LPDAIQLRTALDKDFRPLRGEFLQTLLIELTPGPGLRSLPLNLGILLDVSASMQGTKLDNAKAACVLLLEQMSATDRVALCVFSSGARSLSASQNMTEEARAVAVRAVQALRTEAATELMPGLEQVYREVVPHASAECSSFVIMLSDGEPTNSEGYGETNLEPFLERVDQEFQAHAVSLSTIGLGSAADYNAPFLRDLADRGSGKFLMARDPAELGTVFQEEFRRIATTVLADVTIEVSRLQGMARRFWRVVPDKKAFDVPRVENGAFSIAVGSLQHDQPQAYVLDVVTPAPAEPAERGLLCQVAAAVSSGGVTHRAEQNVLTGYSDNEVELAQRNPEVQKLLEEAVDFKLQMDLEAAAKAGDRRKMTSVLERKKKMTQRLGKTAATKVLEEMESTIESGGRISLDDLAISSAESKKTKRLA